MFVPSRRSSFTLINPDTPPDNPNPRTRKRGPHLMDGAL